MVSDGGGGVPHHKPDDERYCVFKNGSQTFI